MKAKTQIFRMVHFSLLIALGLPSSLYPESSLRPLEIQQKEGGLEELERTLTGTTGQPGGRSEIS